MINRTRPREHHKSLTFQGNPTGDIWWRHVRWKGPTRADIAQLPVAHARTFLRETPLWGHVTSCSHVGHAQWYILYCYYSKKKNAGTGCACARGDVTSGISPPLLPLKYDLNRPDILFTRSQSSFLWGLVFFKGSYLLYFSFLVYCLLQFFSPGCKYLLCIFLFQIIAYGSFFFSRL